MLSASDGLVINSESLLGEVGREFPGLNEMRGQTEIKELFPVSASSAGLHQRSEWITSELGSTLHLSACGCQSAGKSRFWSPRLLGRPVTNS